MALTQAHFKQLRKELDECKNPLFMHDDDPDGFSAFLLFYRYKREGKGYPIKASPIIDEKFLRVVEEYQPDKIFILDVPMISQDFVDQVKIPIVWVDHHGPFDIKGVKYFNPRLYNKDSIFSTSYNCYMAVNQDIWVAMIGIVGDWQLHDDVAKKLREEYPDLLPKNIKRPQDALFDSKIGKLVKIISFLLKGTTSDVKKCIKIMIDAKSPYEILEGTTEGGEFILKKFESMNEKYEELLESINNAKTKSKLLKFIYAGKHSFTKELSNESLYLHPEKVILIARNQNGDYKGSLRSSDILLPPIVKEILVGLQGYGGGHEHACGFCVNEKDFDEFVERLNERI